MPVGSANPFPSLLLVEGTTPATPAAGDQRLFIRSSDHLLCYVNSSGTVATVDTAGTSTLLAVHKYGPSSTATIYTPSSTAYVDVDATNMAITFTAPASGNILVRMSSWADAAATGEGYWGLRESTSNLAGSMGNVLRAQTPGDEAFVSYVVYLTGVGAGSHTYKWSFAADTNASGRTRIILADGSAVTKFAPAIMEVWAAP